MNKEKVILLKDIINLFQFEIISLYYKGSWIGDFKNTKQDLNKIKESEWANDKVCCITYDDSCSEKNIEVYLTALDRNF